MVGIIQSLLKKLMSLVSLKRIVATNTKRKTEEKVEATAKVLRQSTLPMGQRKHSERRAEHYRQTTLQKM